MDFTPEEIKLIEERRAKLAKRTAPKGKLAQLRASLMEAMAWIADQEKIEDAEAPNIGETEMWKRWMAARDATAVSVVRKKKQAHDEPKGK